MIVSIPDDLVQELIAAQAALNRLAPLLAPMNAPAEFDTAPFNSPTE